MKSSRETRPNTSLSNKHPQTPISNGSIHSNANTTQRKAAVHDLTHSIIEECQKVSIRIQKCINKLIFIFLANDRVSQINVKIS